MTRRARTTSRSPTTTGRWPLSPKLAGALFGRRNVRRKRGDPVGREADLAAAKAMRADNTEDWAQYGVR